MQSKKLNTDEGQLALKNQRIPKKPVKLTSTKSQMKDFDGFEQKVPA